jgi:hypothetical protein
VCFKELESTSIREGGRQIGVARVEEFKSVCVSQTHAFIMRWTRIIHIKTSLWDKTLQPGEQKAKRHIWLQQTYKDELFIWTYVVSLYT